MDVGEFLGLEATHNPNRWYLPVAPGLATMGRFLFGGAGLGAAILALERTTDRPVVWATAQYLSYAMIDEIMDLDVTIPAAGRHTAQARVVGRVGDREILTVNAALGERDLDQTGQWAEMPQVPAPDECEVRESSGGVGTSIMSRIESRLAVGQQWDALNGEPAPDGRSAMWVRLRGVEPSAASLAVIGDYVPWGITQAFGCYTRSNSLDNTLRVVQVVPTEWVLLDVRIQAVHHGFGHGDVYQWSSEGTLMGVASQSAIVREVSEPTPGKLPPWMARELKGTELKGTDPK